MEVMNARDWFFRDRWGEMQAEIDALPISEDQKSRLWQQQAATRFAGERVDGEPSYDPTKYRWNVEPDPSDEQCRKCYAWRRFPIGQRHFGFAWWRTCSNRGDCPCEHHRDEFWVG